MDVFVMLGTSKEFVKATRVKLKCFTNFSLPTVKKLVFNVYASVCLSFSE